MKAVVEIAISPSVAIVNYRMVGYHPLNIASVFEVLSLT